MTAADTATLPGEVDLETSAICLVCTHPMAAHDRTAGRYCDATQANALSRRCICSI